MFSLDMLSIDDIKKICEKNDFVFTIDNFLKMQRMLLNTRAKIPIILIGETGMGKTKLVEMFSILYGKGKSNIITFQIHGKTTDNDVKYFIEEIITTKKINKEKSIIFFDNINIGNCLNSIKEIICNDFYIDEDIIENLEFICACNPYKLKNSNKNENIQNLQNNLEYDVKPLPPSLNNFIFDFVALSENDEEQLYNI